MDCHEKFCDSFFYAQEMIPVQMDEGYKEGNYATVSYTHLTLPTIA